MPPTANSPRNIWSRDTSGAAASILATRGWLDLIRAATCFWLKADSSRRRRMALREVHPQLDEQTFLLGELEEVRRVPEPEAGRLEGLSLPHVHHGSPLFFAASFSAAFTASSYWESRRQQASIIGFGVARVVFGKTPAIRITSGSMR